MGDVIQFPGNYRPEASGEIEGAYSPEERDVLRQAHDAAQEAVHDAAISTGSLQFVPQLKRQLDEPGAWGIVLLEGSQEEPPDSGPDLTVV